MATAGDPKPGTSSTRVHGSGAAGQPPRVRHPGGGSGCNSGRSSHSFRVVAGRPVLLPGAAGFTPAG